MTFDQTNGFWIMPTRRRPENLKRFFQAYRDTEATTPGILVVDVTDYRDLIVEYQRINLPTNWHFIVSENEELPGDKWRFVEGHKFCEDAIWLGTLSDDQVPITKHWDTELLSALTPHQYVSCDDGWQTSRITGGVVYPTKLMSYFGGAYPAPFKHYFVDDVQEEIGRETGCWKIRRDILIEHNHHLNGKVAKDSTHEKSATVWEHDQAAFNEWQRNDKERIKRAVLTYIEGRET